MGQNDQQLVVAEGGGHIYVAPVGTTPPADDAAAWAAAWVELGYTTEAGVTFTYNPTRTNIMAWQSLDPVRILETAREVTLGFELEQFDSAIIPFAFGGGTVEVLSPGHYRYDFPDGGIDERALGIEAVDGDKAYRIIVPRGIVHDQIQTSFSKAAAATLPIAFRAMKKSGQPIAYLLSDDPALAASGS